MVYTFDAPVFRAAFPAFANTDTFPNVTLSGYWDTATLFISTDDYGYLNGNARGRAINLMAAHLAQLATQISTGQTSGLVKGATIDKITVTLEPPPVKSQFMWWLNLTPYGAQLAALLDMLSVGGFFVTPCRPPRGLK